MGREFYLDRIRVVLTALVILHHTAITYGAPGGWYYLELPPTLSLTGLFLMLFASVNQAYFMGFFFLIAGYFTPASYNRKGPTRFALDRLIRLGIPLAVFAVVLDPITNSIADAWGRTPAKSALFLPRFVYRLIYADWNDGPLWFAQALLIFCGAYIIWRKWLSRQPSRVETKQVEAPLPNAAAWISSALGVGAAALLIRQWSPVGRSHFGLQLGYFASYIFLFALGTVCWQRNWLERLGWRMARPWAILSVALLPAMVLTVAVSQIYFRKKVDLAGFSIPAIIYAFWEPFLAWGIIAAYLVFFRQYGNQPSKLWQYLARHAYAIYFLHAPVLVAVAVTLRNWHAAGILKFAIVGPLAALATLAPSALLLRIPAARRVL